MLLSSRQLTHPHTPTHTLPPHNSHRHASLVCISREAPRADCTGQAQASPSSVCPAMSSTPRLVASTLPRRLPLGQRHSVSTPRAPTSRPGLICPSMERRTVSLELPLLREACPCILRHNGCAPKRAAVDSIARILETPGDGLPQAALRRSVALTGSTPAWGDATLPWILQNMAFKDGEGPQGELVFS